MSLVKNVFSYCNNSFFLCVVSIANRQFTLMGWFNAIVLERNAETRELTVELRSEGDRRHTAKVKGYISVLYMYLFCCA